MIIEERVYLNHNIKLIHTIHGWTAQIQTEYGWWDLYTYYESKTQLRKALWYFIINH